MQHGAHSDQAEQLRRQAAELRAAAAAIKNPMARASYRRMAETCDALARQVEWRAAREKGPEPR